jgi:hypothetical protein
MVNTMTDLSPAAQAVFNAVLPASDEDALYTCTDEQYAARMAAVALQAAANAVAPEAMPHRRKIRDELLAIAAELETSTTEN